MKTIVYIDGFSLYYAALRGTALKWLDLYALFRDQVLECGTDVTQIRYYTAPVKGSYSDDPASPQRQQRYLRALKAHCGNRIEIIQGFIARTTPILRLVKSEPGSAVEKAKVFQFTEKQTDVNLAADVISDAWHRRSQQAVICSNDSDLVGALAAVRRDHPGLVVGLVAPVRERRTVSRSLAALATWYKVLNPVHLAHAQLPDAIPGTSLRRPDAWMHMPDSGKRLSERSLQPPNAA